MGNMEPKLAIFYNQTRHPEVGLGHQSSHETFDLQSVLSVRCATVMVVQNLCKWPAKDWFNLRPIPGKGYQA